MSRELAELTRSPRVAYFSMEIALASDIPTYSGGLGILAGDTLRTAADLRLPMVAVSLVSRAGYFRQSFDADGRQVEQPDTWDPAGRARRLDAMVAVSIESRQVWIAAWLFFVESAHGGREPVVLLDTDLELNDPADRAITDDLYGGDERHRLEQELVLGVGGARMLRALGFHVLRYHMNEGHSALLTLELLARFAHASESVRPGESPYDLPRVRELCAFTTHTPVESAQDRFDWALVREVLGDAPELAALRAIVAEDRLNLTRLALNLSDYVNGVATRHAEVSRRLFPGYRVHAVSNGVHPATWTAPSFARLYDEHVPGWAHTPELLVRADRIPDAALWRAHLEAKGALLERVAALSTVRLDPERPILGFARRMTAYKRPDLLFSDVERLRALARRRPFQLVLAGKAHPRDEDGKRLMALLHRHVRELDGALPIAFLPNYDLALARVLVAGVDLWLNTPLPPLEASGTSGMKAAFNGVPSLSVLDGWWIDGCVEGVTGWAIGDGSTANAERDAGGLYEKLERVVLPLYDGDRAGWIAVTKGAITKNASFFNSHRMMRRYATEAYLR